MSRALLDDVVLKYIDAKLLVDGYITTKDLNVVFTLGRQKSSKLFSCYREASPNNMVHDLNKRKYVIGSGFKAVYLRDKCPKEYLKSTTIVFN